MPAADPASGLSIAQLSQATGVSSGTLRMWETRHGFPSPTRLPGGHRRYGGGDVERVAAVLQGREEGLSLKAAIARSVASARTVPQASIFAAVTARRPDLQRMTLAKPALLKLTRAIEDEHCAGGGGGVLIGSFQTAAFYRQSRLRWKELARTARVAVALADFEQLRARREGPVEVPVAREHPLRREWAIAFAAAGMSACLAAWEIPAWRAEGVEERRFEAVWSPEPDVARIAIAVAAEAVAPLAPQIAQTMLGEPASPSPGRAEVKSAVSQAGRMLAYLAAPGERERGR